MSFFGCHMAAEGKKKSFSKTFSVYSSYEINIFLFFCGGLQFKPTKRVSFFLKQEGSACQQFQSTRLLEFISCDHPIKKLHSPKLT